jgi:hypothetical protein
MKPVEILLRRVGVEMREKERGGESNEDTL